MDTATSDIRAVEFTPSGDGDSPMLPELSGQISEVEEIGTVTADGAYDTRRCHTAIGHTPATAETHFSNAQLLCIRPAPTATGIGDGTDLNFGSVSMVGHSAGPKLRFSTQDDGPRRGLTANPPFSRWCRISAPCVGCSSRWDDRHL
jgi:hypothetical protein